MIIPVLLVTYNRLEYSKKALHSILENPGMPVEVMIWDNASDQDTQEWLDNIQDFVKTHNLIISVVRSPKNVGLAPAMNYFFKKYASQPYVVKVDNDTVLPDNWLKDLMAAMNKINGKVKLGAVSGIGWRPYGETAQEWFSHMLSAPFGDAELYFHTYIFGTGVLINMDMIRERGLLFEKFPRSPESGPDDPCLISGWTAYCREAAEYEDWKFAMYSKVNMQLLNLKEEHVPSGDYPEYDAEVAKVREEGNRWWDSVGGLEGVRKYVQEHGGLERLNMVAFPIPGGQYKKGQVFEFAGTGTQVFIDLRDPIGAITPNNLLTDCDHTDKLATKEGWEERIREHGTTHSTFLETPQVRINEFTEHHMNILKQFAVGKRVLDVGVGWGRISQTVARMAGSYIGVDFMPTLIEKARESMPGLDFRVADAKALPFSDESFDVVIATTCLSSFATVFDETLKELKRVLRHDGFILFLEENFARIDWKLKNV